MKSILAIVCVLGLTMSASASDLAFWSFDDTTVLPGSTGSPPSRINRLGTPDIKLAYTSEIGSSGNKLCVWTGSGTILGNNGEIASITSTTPPTFGSFGGSTLNDIRATPNSGGSLSIIGNGNNGNYFVLQLDQVLTNGVLSYATRGTATGYNTHTIDYSTNGGQSWTNLAAITGRNVTTYSIQTVTLGNIFAASSGSGQNLLRVAVSGATGATGNNRFDNILITPEPASLMLLGLGGVAILRRRR